MQFFAVDPFEADGPAGAGMAGVAAADAFLGAGVDNVIVLEARNYTGGRLHAVAFGVEPNTILIEEGANWVHGVPSGDSSSLHGESTAVENPMWRLAKLNGLKTTPVPGSCANVSGYRLFTDTGTVVPHEHERAKKAMRLFDCANATGAAIGNKPDITFGARYCFLPGGRILSLNSHMWQLKPSPNADGLTTMASMC
jgi:monoamine oxidase